MDIIQAVNTLEVRVAVWTGSKQTDKNQPDFIVWTEPTFNFTSNRGPRPIQRGEPAVTEQLSQWKRADKRSNVAGKACLCSAQSLITPHQTGQRQATAAAIGHIFD